MGAAFDSSSYKSIHSTLNLTWKTKWQPHDHVPEWVSGGPTSFGLTVMNIIINIEKQCKWILIDQAQRVSRPFRSSSPSWRQTQVRVRCGTSSADSAARPQRTAPYFPAPSHWGPQALTCRRALSSATHPLSPSLKSKLNDSASTLRHKTHFTLNSLSLKLYWWLFLKQSHSKTPGCWAFLKPLQTVSAEHHTASHGRLCRNDEKRGQTVGKANCPRQLLFTLKPCQPRDMLRDPWSTQ